MIAINQLTFSYPNNQIFENLTFSSASRFIVIKGPSGSGKTTLLKLLAGVLSSGNTEALSRFQKPSLILQEDALFPWMTGLENVSHLLPSFVETIETHPLYRHVAPFIKRHAYEMSYGQRRMIELFRVILYKPDLLCLDEPFNFLDPRYRKLILEYLLANNGTLSNTTIVMSTHYSEDTSGLGLETIYVAGSFPIRQLLTDVEFKNYA